MRNINFATILRIFSKYNPTASGTVEYFQVKSGSEKAHFCSLIYSIEITVRNKDNSRSKFTVMIKTIPDNSLRIQFVQDSQFFLKEIAMYTEIVPNIMAKAGFANTFPLIYDTYSSVDEANYYIVMEDLTEKGYISYPKRVSGLDEHHCKFLIKKLAHFHATSFIKYKGNGAKLQSDYPSIKEHFWKTNLERNEIPEMNLAFILRTMEQITKLLNKKGLGDGISLVEKKMAKGHAVLSELALVPDNYPAVITHGDCWTSNVLYKYDDKEMLEDIKFVDFQMSRVASRITDLSYFIFTSANPSVLNEKLDDFLRLYFDTFNGICEEFGEMQLPLVYNMKKLTWEYFLEEWDFYKNFGLVSSLLYVAVMYSDPENPPDMENIEENDLSLQETQTERNGTFDDIWEYKPMQKILFNLIFKHLS